MTYQEIERYISEIPKFTKKHSLSHTKRFLEILQIPQGKMKILHVAGTNGKGSVCAYLDAMLRSEGKRTGLFISPHLVKMNERIMIDGVPVSDEVFSEVFTQTLGAVKQMEAEGLEHPTFFEFLFGMGMLAFSQAEAEYVILETGLGGRLDATTAVENPVACVITSISLDHMQFLGNTVREIAGEKAGIIVPGVPVIYDGNDKDAAEVIAAKAKELGSPAYKVIQAGAKVLGNNKDGIDFSLEDDYYGDIRFHIPFIAWYQVMNASLALTTMEVLKDRIPVTMEQLQAGIANTRWQGRMETILPGVIVDGAHNEDGVRRFVETAERFQKEYPLTLLFSAVNDKDYQDMIHTICSRIKFRKVVTTEVGGYREVPSAELAEIFCKEGCKDVGNSDNIEEAFHMAHEAKGEDGMLFCVGSLYLVGEIKTLLLKK